MDKINQKTNYNNGKIYKIINSVNDKIYVGSTCNELTKRLMNHKSYSKKNPNIKLYENCNLVGWGNVKIELVEDFSCNDRVSLVEREQYYIEQLKPELNKNYAKGLDKEKEKKSKSKYAKSEKFKLCLRKYRNTEKGKLSNKRACQKYSKTEKGKKAFLKAQNKENYISYKKNYMKEYNERKLKEKVECECGKKVCVLSKKSHENSKKHIEQMKQKTNKISVNIHE
jgi:hypothetical protein